jgi:hypothetical protein
MQMRLTDEGEGLGLGLGLGEEGGGRGSPLRSFERTDTKEQEKTSQQPRGVQRVMGKSLLVNGDGTKATILGPE